MAVQFDIVTLFPELFGDFLRSALVGRAISRDLMQVHLHALRNWSEDRRGTVDDAPFGGGDGMILKPEPLSRALDDLLRPNPERKVIYLTPEGAPFTSARARGIAEAGGAILLCGRYGGIDERIRALYQPEEISIGDYVLSGGEIPAMVVVEAASRFIPGVLGNEESAAHDSFEANLLEGPQYTRPRVFRDLAVPEVLMQGNHEEISRWRQAQARLRTASRRPDLLASTDCLSDKAR